MCVICPRAALWLEKVHQVKNKVKKILVCERHFEARYVNRNNELRTRLVMHAVPTLFLPQAEALTCTPDVAGGTSPGKLVPKRLTRRITTPKAKQRIADFINKNQQLLGNPSRHVAEIIALHKRFSGKKKGWKYTDEFKFFALKLYCLSPNTYKAMQSVLSLPKISTLYRYFIPSSTSVCENLIIALKIKVDNMTAEQKECAVCIGTLDVKANLYYDVKKDLVTGFHDVDGIQRLEPAQTALVVMVRGLYHNWKQAISCSFLAHQEDYSDVRTYILKIISKMFGIGLSVRVLISDVETDFIGLSKECKINSRSPVFQVNNNKVYYLYDTAHLMKNVRECFTTNNIYFNFKIARWEHITACYDHECNKPVRLAPQLTSYHIIHTYMQSEKDKVKLAAEVFSRQTAAAVATYAELKVIDEPVDGTVDWILLMNKLFNLLNFTSYLSHDRVPFTGEEWQLNFLEETLTVLRDVRLVDVHRGSDVTNQSIVLGRLKAALKVVVLLHRDLEKKYHKFPSLLSRDCLDSFFDAERKVHGHLPTCRQIQLSISTTPIFNMFQSLKNKSTDSLDRFLKEAVEFYEFVVVYEQIQPRSGNVCLESIREPDVQTVALPRFTARLLFEGRRRHLACERTTEYVFEHPAGTSVKLNFKANNRCVGSVDVTVPMEFLQFIESMETTLKLYFERECQRNILKGLTDRLLSITFPMPCECYPLEFVKCLYMRFRFHLMIMYNNEEYEKSADVKSRKCFVVNELCSNDSVLDMFTL